MPCVESVPLFLGAICLNERARIAYDHLVGEQQANISGPVRKGERLAVANRGASRGSGGSSDER
jgi:hypothetical protein